MPYSKHFKVIGRARDDEENDDGMLVEVQFEKQVDKEQVDEAEAVAFAWAKSAK